MIKHDLYILLLLKDVLHQKKTELWSVRVHWHPPRPIAQAPVYTLKTFAGTIKLFLIDFYHPLHFWQQNTILAPLNGSDTKLNASFLFCCFTRPQMFLVRTDKHHTQTHGGARLESRLTQTCWRWTWSHELLRRTDSYFRAASSPVSDMYMRDPSHLWVTWTDDQFQAGWVGPSQNPPDGLLEWTGWESDCDRFLQQHLINGWNMVLIWIQAVLSQVDVPPPPSLSRGCVFIHQYFGSR